MKWLKLDLGPVMRKYHPSIMIFSFDDQKRNILDWRDALDDPETNSQFVDGVAFHWYKNVDFQWGVRDQRLQEAFGDAQVCIQTRFC